MMKSKYILAGLFGLAVAGVIATDADAAAQKLVRQPDGSYKVVYQYQDKPDYGQWYVGLKYVQNFASFDMDYTMDGGNNPETESVSFGSQPGGSVVVGNKFHKNWRGELELGYTGVYSDHEDWDDGNSVRSIDFKISAPYAHANIIYDFDENRYGGFYLGAGVGVAMPTTKIIAPTVFYDGNESKTETSILFAGMAGWQKTLTQHLMLDVGLKIWMYDGTTHTRDWTQIVSPGVELDHTFTDTIDWILNTSLTVGLKYVF